VGREGTEQSIGAVIAACFRDLRVLWVARNGQRWTIQSAVALLALVIVVAPWFARNYQKFHQFIPFRDASWLVMHVGNNGDTSHWASDQAHPSSNSTEKQEFNRLGELNCMSLKRCEVIQLIRSHPGS
jgi:hypothetical protein